MLICTFSPQRPPYPSPPPPRATRCQSGRVSIPPRGGRARHDVSRGGNAPTSVNASTVIPRIMDIAVDRVAAPAIFAVAIAIAVDAIRNGSHGEPAMFLQGVNQEGLMIFSTIVSAEAVEESSVVSDAVVFDGGC